MRWTFLCGLLTALACRSAAAAEPTAPELMTAAHEGRAVWKDFPGFGADIVAKRDSQVAKGTLDVAADGQLTLRWRGEEKPDWVERSLSSIINHRLPGGEAITKVEFADDKQHPLGRLIRSTEPSDKSLWRVQRDVLTEVHRLSEKARMIISIADVTRTADGKHLPHNFTTTTFNAATGAIESSRQVLQEWKPVDQVYLPTRVVAMVSTGSGERHVEEITLSNHWLRPRRAEGQSALTELPALPAPVTSFGAAVSGGHLYVFGGHLGTVHKYSREEQAHELLRLNLASPKAWEVVGEAPRRTGTALVAYKDHLYRVGGWEARNDKSADADLHSLADFARFDTRSGKWEDLSPLPEGRSSHDAAIIGGKLYVVGGWMMGGDAESEYHSTAYVADLDQAAPKWTPIAKPPFMRRAIALAANKDKLYVIGGMDDANETTTAVAIYDSAADKWSTGPKLPGRSIDGFAASAFGVRDRLYATSAAGYLFQLSADGSAWEEATKLAYPRMSHRLVGDGERLYVVGGAARGGAGGKVPQVEMIEFKAAKN